MGSAPRPWSHPALRDKFSRRQDCLLEKWNTYLRNGQGRYLVQPIAGDLVVFDPDIGHVVVNVSKPHLWEGGLDRQEGTAYSHHGTYSKS